MLRAPADAVPKVRPASPATASPVRETRMQAWKRSRTSPVKKRAAMIRANRRRRLYPGVLMAGRDGGFGIGDSEKRGRGDVNCHPESRDRKSVGEGKSVEVRVDLGGRRVIK